MENPEIKKAVTQLEESAFSKEQLLGYDHFWDVVSTAKMQISSSRREGLEEGEKIGIEKGEKKKAKEMARLMKADNEPMSKIIRYTNLSEEEINSL
jgi:predicted transposase/invertase (TIGR01784 family)